MYPRNKKIMALNSYIYHLTYLINLDENKPKIKSLKKYYESRKSWEEKKKKKNCKKHILVS